MVSALHLHLAACLDSKYLIHFKLNYLVSEMASIDFFFAINSGPHVANWPCYTYLLSIKFNSRGPQWGAKKMLEVLYSTNLITYFQSLSFGDLECKNTTSKRFLPLCESLQS